MENSSFGTLRIQLKHLGERRAARDLALADVQRHINRRAKKQYRGKPINSTTICKGVTTLRAVWNWASAAGWSAARSRTGARVRQDRREAPPFLTRAEIERKAAGLETHEADELWECPYLRKQEVDELLAFVKANATHPRLHPMLCTAALTGARRSELLRAVVSDVDLTADTILIHEKKRSKKQRTTRHVSLTALLKTALTEWLAVHPGGRFLVCQAGVVARSKNRSRTTGHQSGDERPTSFRGRQATVQRRAAAAIAPVTKDEAHDHFKRATAGSKWEVLKGWHVLRHSFISCLAAAGVDQRIIDEFVGHTTPEQQKRYRHLIPDVKQKAISGVFG